MTRRSWRGVTGLALTAPAALLLVLTRVGISPPGPVAQPLRTWSTLGSFVTVALFFFALLAWRVNVRAESRVGAVIAYVGLLVVAAFVAVVVVDQLPCSQIVPNCD